MDVGRARVLIDAVYRSWASGDIDATLARFREDAVFSVNPGAASFVGNGLGRRELARRLALFQDKIAVSQFAPVQLMRKGIWFDSRVAFHYRHKQSGQEIDGIMRITWRFVDTDIAHFELFHDAGRMGAFFKMVAAEEFSA